MDRVDRVDRFLVDVMCGRLSTYLRMCGYDAVYAHDRGIEDDDLLRRLARDEGRRLITRDVELASRTDGAILLRSRDVEGQLRELVGAGVELELTEPIRCSRCNGALVRVDGDGQTPEYAPDLTENAVWKCEQCGQCFWKGSHWDAVEATLDRVEPGRD